MAIYVHVWEISLYYICKYLEIHYFFHLKTNGKTLNSVFISNICIIFIFITDIFELFNCIESVQVCYN